MTDPLEPKYFAEILRNEGHPRWQEAYDKLVRMLASYLRTGRPWARVGRPVGSSEADDLARDLAHDFWLWLKQDRRRLNVEAIRGWGAIRRELYRFLTKPSQVSIETAEAGLREHFAEKLRRVLRSGRYRDLRHGARGGLWGPVELLAERSADPTELMHARSNQPPLNADWKPQNPKQDPPIARPKAMGEHLDSLFKLIGVHCWFSDLHELSWSALTPPWTVWLRAYVPDEPFSDGFRDFRLDRLLQAYFDKLDKEVQVLVKLKYRDPSASERKIEGITGVPKSTVGRKLELFRTDLREHLREEGYNLADKEMERALWDVFGS